MGSRSTFAIVLHIVVEIVQLVIEFFASLRAVGPVRGMAPAPAAFLVTITERPRAPRRSMPFVLSIGHQSDSPRALVLMVCERPLAPER